MGKPKKPIQPHVRGYINWTLFLAECSMEFKLFEEIMPRPAGPDLFDRMGGRPNWGSSLFGQVLSAK
jgi:hypothetical protein